MLQARSIVAATVGAVAALSTLSGCVTPSSVSASKTGDLSAGLGLRERPDAAQVAACGDGAPTLAGAPALVRQPYVQRTTGTSAVVMWTTTDDTPVRVSVTTPAGEAVASVAAVGEPAKHFSGQRVAEIEGLEPGATYCYQLEAGKAALTERAGFRTAPPPGSGEPVRFVAFGDSGDGGDEQWLVRNQLDTVPFDLMLVTGDVAYSSGTPKQLERGFFEVYQDLIRFIPTFPVAGNHDYETDEGAPLREAFALPENGGQGGEERWYSFDWGDVHFVGLDTEVMSEAQAAWLEADLAANDLPWVVVFAHRPPLSSGRHGSNEQFQRLFSPILRAHQVPLVLAGHDHHYERTHAVDGLTTIVTGGGGHGVRSVGASSFTAFAESVLHFVHVEIEGDRLTLRAIDATGRVFDTMTLTR